MDPWVQSIGTLAVGLLAGGGTIYLVKANRGKIEADTASTLTTSASNWIDKLEERISGLEGRVADLEHEVAGEREITAMAERRNGRLLRWTTMLQAQIIERGGVPVALEDIPD